MADYRYAVFVQNDSDLLKIKPHTSLIFCKGTSNFSTNVKINKCVALETSK